MSLDDKVQIVKASVSNIVYTLVPSEWRPNYGACSRGNMLHYKLGYMNILKFTRYMQIDDIIVVVSGVPDKIDYQNKCVRELKTSRNGLTNKQKLRAKLQLWLYTWLTGMNRGYLDVYNLNKQELKLGVLEVYRDEERVEEILRDYVGWLKFRREANELLQAKYGENPETD